MIVMNIFSMAWRERERTVLGKHLKRYHNTYQLALNRLYISVLYLKQTSCSFKGSALLITGLYFKSTQHSKLFLKYENT